MDLDATANKQMVQDFGAAVFSRLLGADADPGRFLTDDVVYWLPQSVETIGIPERYEGRQAVLSMLSEAALKYYVPETMTFDYHSSIAEADRVAAHFTLRAKTVTGKDYENHYQILYRCQDGLIAEVWEYFDTAYFRSFFLE